MEAKANKRLVLTSVNQILTLAQQNSEIVNRVPKLNILVGRQMSTTPKKACNCGAKKNIQTADANKQIAEQVLSTLNYQDFVSIKNVLELDQLCYYKRNIADNSLQLHCV
jgi:hypothetical protein